MLKKWNLSILEIVVVGIISLILIVLIIPGILNIINITNVDNMKMEAKKIYVSAVKEQEEYAGIVKYFCYKSEYGYPKTLDDSDTKSLQNIQDGDMSYLIEFNEKGGAVLLLIIKNNKVLLIEDYVNDISIDTITKNDIISVEKGYEILNKKCEYRVG